MFKWVIRLRQEHIVKNNIKKYINNKCYQYHEIKAIPKHVWIRGGIDLVNIRYGAGLDYMICDTQRNGELVILLGSVVDILSKDLWYYIEYGNKQARHGFIKAQYIE